MECLGRRREERGVDGAGGRVGREAEDWGVGGWMRVVMGV
jgi:hypothetical protein